MNLLLGNLLEGVTGLTAWAKLTCLIVDVDKSFCTEYPDFKPGSIPHRILLAFSFKGFCSKIMMI